MRLRSIMAEGNFAEPEYQEFWDLLQSASLVLRASNTELTSRAKVGNGFFSSVPREKRRPKQTNIFKALSAIIDVANERLYDVDRSKAASSIAVDGALTPSVIINKRRELLALSNSLRAIAQREIERLARERPNSDEGRMLKSSVNFSKFSWTASHEYHCPSSIWICRQTRHRLKMLGR